MELKQPMAVRILLPCFWCALECLVLLPLLLRSAQVLGSGDLGCLPLLLSVAVPWLLATTLGLARAWQSAHLRIVAGERGIALRGRSRTTSIAWQEVEVCREEGSPLERDGASRVVLRDCEGNVLLAWQRSWFGHSKRSLRDFDRFTAFVQDQVARSHSQAGAQVRAESQSVLS